MTYSYKLTNTGNVTLSPPFTVTDNKLTVSCANLTAPIAPNGGVAFCTPVNYTGDPGRPGRRVPSSTPRPRAAKLLTQTVTSAADSVTVITYAGARLGLTKSANPNYFSASGQNITYTFTLRNTGGLVLNAPYTVTDPLIPSVNCAGASPTIPVGGSTTCTGTTRSTAADSLLGSFTNLASAQQTAARHLYASAGDHHHRQIHLQQLEDQARRAHPHRQRFERAVGDHQQFWHPAEHYRDDRELVRRAAAAVTDCS